MADQYEQNKPSVEETVGANVEATDRGLFDFIGKKEEVKPSHAHEEEAVSSEFCEKVKVSEEEEHKEEKKEEKKLHRSSSSSSSSVSLSFILV
uniref:Putative ovule protein n=1 Tax=Solanum chacoense TaxID=4108 RepID=A0A0V0I3L9_SOLCH